MHIVLLANDTTCIYNLRKEVMTACANQGNKITVVGQTLGFTEELREMGVDIADIQVKRRGTNPFADLRLFCQYLSTLKTLKPDVALTYNIKPNVYGGMTCKILKIPYMPNITGLGTAVEIPGPMQKLTTFLYKLGVSGARTLFFQNTENLEFFRSRKMINKKTKVRLLPGSGVNLQSHPVLPYPNEDKVHFLFVARVLKEKGIDQYLAAAKALRAERDDVVFHVCGGCDDVSYQTILEQLQEDGVVQYHGQQKDMLQFYRQAGCIVHPSYYPEGMSNVLLEAAASGRPIIAANRSGCREIVDNEKTGYIVPIMDNQAVVDAVRRVLALTWAQRREMGLAGRAKVEKEFDRRLVVEAYLEEL